MVLAVEDAEEFVDRLGDGDIGSEFYGLGGFILALFHGIAEGLEVFRSLDFGQFRSFRLLRGGLFDIDGQAFRRAVD